MALLHSVSDKVRKSRPWVALRSGHKEDTSDESTDHLLSSSRTSQGCPHSRPPILGGEHDHMHITARLSDASAQYWALCFAMLATVIAEWAQTAPLLCVKLDEVQAVFPSKCQGIVGDTQGLRLPDFCWKSCVHGRSILLLWSLAFAVILQSIVVILNHKGCQQWMLMMMQFDVQQGMDAVDEIIQDTIEDESGVVQQTAQHSTTGGYVIKKVLIIFQTLKAAVMSRVLTMTQTNAGTPLVSASGAATSAQLLILIAFSRNSAMCFWVVKEPAASFGCDGQEALLLKASLDWAHFIAHLVASALLLMTLIFQRSARWTVQIQMGDIEPDHLMLRSQFSPDWYTKGVIRDEFKELRHVSFMRLVHVEHSGFIDEPSLAFASKVTLEDVTLHFDDDDGRPEWMPANKHRAAAIGFQFIAAVSALAAYFSCWVCVSGIHIGQGATNMEVFQWVYLLGTCGRHDDVGHASALAGFLLILALLSQLVIISQSDPSYHGGTVVHRVISSSVGLHYHYPLWCNLVDLRPVEQKMRNPQLYELARTEPPEFYCHVWVTDPQDVDTLTQTNLKHGRTMGSETSVQLMQEDHEIIADCREFSQDICSDAEGSSTMYAKESFRGNWRKSKRHAKVKLEAAPQDYETLSQWMHGLMRDDYSPPSICIRIGTEQEDLVQMVPRQFFAGGLQLWVNLGPKNQWEYVSGGLTFFALILMLADIILFFFLPNGKHLSACSDIKNSNRVCFGDFARSEWEAETILRLEFEKYGGSLKALTGAGCSLLACWLLRVAHKMEARHGFKATCQEYGAALFFIFGMFWFLIRAACGSLWSCCRSFCRKHCCSRRASTLNEASLQSLDEDDDHTFM